MRLLPYCFIAALLAMVISLIIFNQYGDFSGSNDWEFHVAKISGQHNVQLDKYPPLFHFLASLMPFSPNISLLLLLYGILFFAIPYLISRLGGENAAFVYLFAMGVNWFFISTSTVAQATSLLWILCWLAFPQIWLLWLLLALLTHKYGFLLLLAAMLLDFIWRRLKWQ